GPCLCTHPLSRLLIHAARLRLGLVWERITGTNRQRLRSNRHQLPFLRYAPQPSVDMSACPRLRSSWGLLEGIMNDGRDAGASVPVPRAVSLVKGVAPEPSAFITQRLPVLFVLSASRPSKARMEWNAILPPSADHAG